MANYDRNGTPARRPQKGNDDPTGTQIAVATLQMFVILLGIFISFRCPLPFPIRLIMAALVLAFGARWVIKTYRRSV